MTSSQWSVRTLLTGLVVACLLPGVIGASLLFAHQYREGRAQQEEDTIQTARALLQAVDSYLLRVQTLGQALATDDALAQGDLGRFHGRARKAVDTSGLAANIVLRASSEQLVLNALVPFGDPLPVQPSREHVRRVFSTGLPSISNLYRVPQFRHPIVSIDVPVFINGRVEYALGVSVFPQDLSRILRTQNLPEGWVGAVLDASATIAGRNISPERFIGNKATAGLLQGLTEAREGSISAISQEGIPVQTAYTRSLSTGWAVAIGIPRQSLQEALLRSSLRLAAGVAALFVIGLILAWLFGGRIARSVRALTVPASALGRGEAVTAPVVELREAGEVGAALVQAAGLLHQRTAALHTREMELAEAHTRLRDVIDSTPALIYLKDLNGNLMLTNRAYQELVNPDSPGVKENRPAPWHRPGEGKPSAADLQVLSSGTIVQFEEEIETAAGIRHFAISKAPLHDRSGQLIGICAAAVDISRLKSAERQVRELVDTLENRVRERTDELHSANTQLLDVNAQLEDANSQLEAFSYTVAHDLRAPLRGIQGFADALIEDYEEKLDRSGQDYLQRISRAAGRMEQLINDLLAFSRMSRMPLPLGRVDLGEVLHQVLANLDAQIRASNARIELASPMPAVVANRTACLQIFQNLISNAIKFSRQGADVSVTIRAECRVVEQNTTGLVRIWVEDNGIGIPAAQQQRIFQPFERLHGVSEYPGSGIGLAIVDKAATRMHGHCGVESELNGGSRFWVELPASARES